MPAFSQRATQIPSSPIRKLVPYSEAAKARGVHVYHLNIGQPDIKTPEVFLKSIQQAGLSVVAYTHSAGRRTLREQIGAYYNRLGYPVNSEQVLVTTGGSEALSFVFTAILDPGDEVIVPEPFYANYLSFAIGQQGVIVPISSTIEDNFALPSIEEFEKKITSRTRAILITNPSNPTGAIYPPEALEKLGALAKKHDLFLVSDEVYREFVYRGEVQSVLGLEGLEEHAIVIDSISKRFSSCGARIGSVISRNEDLIQTILKMGQARLCPPLFGQLGAEAMYQLPPSYYKEVVHEYSLRCHLLTTALSKMEGVVCPQIDGAFYAMVRLPVQDAEDFCRWLLESFEHEGATVMLAPGAGFYATPGAGRNEVRIAYVLDISELAKAMDCLQAGLAAYRQVKS